MPGGKVARKRKSKEDVSKQLRCPHWPQLLAEAVAAHSADSNLLQPITLVCGDPPIERQTHALTVLGFSEPLRAIMAAGGIESDTRRLVMPEVTAQSCEGILSYINTGSVMIDGDKILEFLRPSTRICVSTLQTTTTSSIYSLWENRMI